jgi:RimJ/RimL family protein N-acetyltransferase
MTSESTVMSGTGAVGPVVDANPARRPERITLEGRHVVLVPLEPAQHGARLFEESRGPERERLWRYLSDGPYTDRATFEAELQRKANSADAVFLTIVRKRDDAALGYASYMCIKPADRVIEVGNILYTPPLQATTAATEAMFLMARHVFEDLGYRRYEWKCNALNAPSRSAALRLGFTFEGIFRQHMIVKGRSRDTAWYSMLDTEWPSRKTAFERWLAPENFDADGRQRESLSAMRPADDRR